LNSSRSSLASSRTIPALKRPTAGVHSTTARSAATTTTSHLSVTSKTTNKLSKTRDSLGLARNHLNGNANRTKATNSTAAFPDKKRIMHASDPTKTTTSSHSTIPTSITHNTSGVIDNMRKVLEQRLNVSLPHERDQLATSLADGIHLCNFVNSVRARSVPTVLTSSSPTVRSQHL
uniref:Calponin-homology (CH) domain-containing protein n=1 Tax=Anisakis simplex TaxID=6269 RepID=A0A0M3K8Z8_ANISI